MGSQTLWRSKQTLRKRESNRSEGRMRLLGRWETSRLDEPLFVWKDHWTLQLEGFESVFFFAGVEPSKWRQFFGRVRILMFGWWSYLIFSTLVVEPTPLEKYARQNGWIFPNFRGENKTCLKPPPSIALEYCITSQHNTVWVHFYQFYWIFLDSWIFYFEVFSLWKKTLSPRSRQAPHLAILRGVAQCHSSDWSLCMDMDAILGRLGRNLGLYTTNRIHGNWYIYLLIYHKKSTKCR